MLVTSRPHLGPTTILDRYEAHTVKIYRPQQWPPPRGQALGPAATYEPGGILVEEVSDGLPHATWGVIRGLNVILAEPGPKRIRLIPEDEGAAGILGDGDHPSLALHVHLLETTSRLQYEGEPVTYELRVNSGRGRAPAA